MCSNWFKQFESCNFDLKDEERPGHPKKFEDEDLEALLDEDHCQTLKQLSDTLNVTEIAISKRLHNVGLVQKATNLLPHKLSQRQLENRKIIREFLLEKCAGKSFLHRIVTSDEEWAYYKNPERQKAWVLPGEPQRQNTIFMLNRWCCIFGGIKKIWYTASCWNRVKRSHLFAKNNTQIVQNIAEKCQEYFEFVIAIEILSQHFCWRLQNI